MARLLLVLLAVSTVAAQTTPTIVTVAGGGPDNLPASSVSLLPYSVAVNARGDIFLAEYVGTRVYKIDVTTGRLTTVAGSNISGFSGDGGLGTRARLRLIRGLMVDPAGNLFIADSGNARVRRLDAITGIITTVAGGGAIGSPGDGGPATSAWIDGPWGIARDQAGNLFVAEYWSSRIRRVDATTGIITTVAGTGTTGFSGDGGPATSAEMGHPRGLAVDTAGNLYIADADNSRIRRVSASTGVIDTVAGGGTSFTDRYYGDDGPAIQARFIHPDAIVFDSAGNLLIADSAFDDPDGSWTGRVRQVDGATGIITRVAGGGSVASITGDGGPATSAILHYPEGLAIDSFGNLLIADPGRSDTICCLYTGSLRRVETATGVISSIAGGGKSLGDGGLATDALIDFPLGVTYDHAGNLLIGDGPMIRRVDARTKVITTIAGCGASAYFGDGGPAIGACIRNTYSVVANGAGDIFVADRNNHRIRRVDGSTGNISTYAGNGTGDFSGDGGAATQAGLKWPYGVALDGAGNLLIADTYNARIRRVDSATGVISTVAGNGVYAFAGDGGPATLASIKRPVSVAVDASGNIFVAERDACRIRRVDASTGIITTVAGDGTCAYGGDDGPATSAQLYLPVGIAVGVNGDLLIAEELDARIRRVDAATGIITTAAGNGFVGFDGDGGPATSAMMQARSDTIGIAFRADGSFAFADTRNRRVRLVSSQSLGAGAVSDDELSLSATPDGDLQLAWSGSCVASDDDYEVYEGTLGAFTSHVARLCSTQGATSTTLRPSPGSAYYLVVPRNSFKEGSYGQSSDGSERPQGVSACLPREIASTCPP